MGFFTTFNRAQIGFPLKEISYIDGVEATTVATTAAAKAQKLADTTKYFLERQALGLTKGVTTSLSQDALVVSTASDYYWLEVEFNPNTLRYTAMNGSFQQQQSVTGDIGSHIAQYNVDAQTTLKFEMYVDSAICLAATTGLSASTVVSGIANLLKGRDYYNIAPIVDGLCSLCNDVETQYVIFAWGKMIFYGVLEEVNAEFVMFDADGKPIRAKVNMSIRQSSKITKDENKDSIVKQSQQYWDDVYDNFFGKGNQKLQFGSSMQSFNNLLNLK